MDLYAQNILEHYRNPKNSGKLSRASITHTESNISCGDIAEVDARIENNILSDIRFRSEGCAISVAALSIVSEQVKGKTLEEILAMNMASIKKYLGIEISNRRAKCAALGLLAIQNAILKQQKKSLLSFSDIMEE